MSEVTGTGAVDGKAPPDGAPEVDFDVLFDHYYPVVRRFFARRAPADDAAELTQDTFLRIHTGLKGFRGEAALGTWVFRIAYNTWAQWARRRASHPESDYGQFPGNPSETGPGAGTVQRAEERSATAPVADSPLEAALAAERREALEEAVRELPEQMGKCMRLRLYQELSYREIATVLCISVDTVKAHLFQARRKLSERLGGDSAPAAGRQT